MEVVEAALMHSRTVTQPKPHSDTGTQLHSRTVTQAQSYSPTVTQAHSHIVAQVHSDTGTQGQDAEGPDAGSYQKVGKGAAVVVVTTCHHIHCARHWWAHSSLVHLLMPLVSVRTAPFSRAPSLCPGLSECHAHNMS